MHLNRGRIWLGGLAGGVVWTLWSFLVGKYVITDARYVAAQNAGFVPENAALSLLRSPVDRAPVYSGDRGLASLCLGASDSGTGSRQLR